MPEPIPFAPPPKAAASKQPWPKRVLVTVFLCFGVLHLAPAKWIESVYCEAIYPQVFRLQKAAFGGLSFSASEVLLLLATCAVMLLSIRGLSGILRQTITLSIGVQAGIVRGVFWTGLCYLTFLGLWGFHHARLPYATHIGLDRFLNRPELAIQTAELEALCRSLVTGCNQIEPLVDQNLISMESNAGQSLALTAMANLSKKIPIFGGREPSFRLANGSPLLSRLGISGIYSPFTGDAHLNGQQPSWARPFTACHEMAHQLGIAREGEANFVAWQACMGSDSNELRYSAYMVALGSASNALFGLQGGREDSVVFEILAGLSPEVKEQRNRAAAWWAEMMGLAGNLAQATNHAYLRSQGQADGVESYGHLVDLILADRRREDAELRDRKQAAE